MTNECINLGKAKAVNISKKIIFLTISIIFFVIICFVFFTFLYAPKRNNFVKYQPKTVNDHISEQVVDLLTAVKLQPQVNNNIIMHDLHKAKKLIENKKTKIHKKILTKNSITEHNFSKYNNAKANYKSYFNVGKEALESPISVYVPDNNGKNSFSSNTNEHENDMATNSANLSLNKIPLPQNDYASQNSQLQKENFLQKSLADKTTKIDAYVTKSNKYSILAGSVIPAILQTKIDSDLPGTIIAKVSRNVYDTVSGNYLLIPQGSTLVGSYDSKVSYAQSRLLAVWKRLLFPNGNSIKLLGMPAVDQIGKGGLADKTNNHYWKIFGSAFMLSLIGTSEQLGKKINKDNDYSALQALFASVNQQFTQTSSQLLSKNMNIQPTITIRNGTKFNVLLTRDLILPNAYH